MKALTFKIPAISNASIKVERDLMEKFYSHYHTHEELQLIWMVKGEGTAFIGDKILPFKDGELYLVSSNLPHVFKSDSSLELVESLSIYFGQSIFEANNTLPEFDFINHFLESFSQGAVFKRKASSSIKEQMILIENSIGINRILLLMELVNLIADQKDFSLIASNDYSTPNNRDGEKISGVIEHLYSNYSKNITLDEVAEIAHMTPQAFCRYFKRHTRKSMVQYLNQIRIGKVCNWLQENKYSVTQSCYQAGFNNISNFNRHFKSVTGYTPSGYMAQQKTLANV